MRDKGKPVSLPEHNSALAATGLLAVRTVPTAKEILLLWEQLGVFVSFLTCTATQGQIIQGNDWHELLCVAAYNLDSIRCYVLTTLLRLPLGGALFSEWKPPVFAVLERYEMA